MTRRYLALLLGAGVLIAFVRWLGGLEGSLLNPVVPEVAVRLRHAAVILRAKGQPEAEVRARTVEVSRDLRTATFTEIERVLIYFRGKPFLRLDARRVVFDQVSHDLTLEGVSAVSTRGERLRADSAAWDQQTGRITLAGNVAIAVDNAVLRGARVVVDTRAQVVEVDGGADVTVDLGTLP